MDHFPIYMKTDGARIVLSGGGDAAIAKLRLLVKTQAQLDVFATAPSDAIRDLAQSGKISLHSRDLRFTDIAGASLVYAADEDNARDQDIRAMAQAQSVPVNIVDNLQDSDFITPAIVDRDPVTIAIGTEGAAPVLARAIKASLEEDLSPVLGKLAEIGKSFRSRAFALPAGRARRDFWADYYNHAGPQAYANAGDAGVRDALDALLIQHLNEEDAAGRIDLIGTGAGEADMLSIRARRAIDRADIVIADADVSGEILELARREAEFLPATTPAADILNAVRDGASIVRLKPGTGTPDTLISEALAAGVDCAILPGLPFTQQTTPQLQQGQRS